MADSKLANVWQIIRNHRYESLAEIQHEMICSLCKRLLVNARISSCGCRFCFSCISVYLEGENKTCPGNTEDCKLEILNLNGNVVVDYAMNIKIPKMRVKCSEISCDYVDELRKMEDHSRMCKCRSVACPYVNIGCDKCNISQDKVADHLQSEIMVHTKLLMNFVTNFNNEMQILKANNNKLTTENEFVREKIAELQRKYDEKSATIDQLNGENVAMRGNMERNQEEIAELQRKCAELQRKCADQVEQRSNIMQCGEYLWKLDKFSDKMANAKKGINRSIYSKSFLTHANGYQMCLRVDPDGFGKGKGTHLSVSFYLMKGEFDSILQWPFRHSVKVALINQRTRRARVSCSAKCVNDPNDPNIKEYMQPTDRNNGLRFPQFIRHAALSSNPDLMRNNEIFIKCSVDLDS